MSRRAFTVALSLAGCGAPAVPDTPAMPDTPAAREAAAVCAAEASPARVSAGEPDWRFREAFAAAAGLPVSPDMKALMKSYGFRDLSEQAAMLRIVAAEVGVRECPLADKLEAVAAATPNPADARRALNVLEAAQIMPPDLVDETLAVGCGEIASCGRACVPGLAVRDFDAGRTREQTLADGCAEFRPQADGGSAARAAFIRARVTAFLGACGPLLSGAEAARFAELRRGLGL